MLAASAYNSRAWFRAIHGTELDQALADANASLRRVADDENVIDTKGYILLQLKRLGEALPLLRRSSRGYGSGVSLGGRQYRYAVALEWSGDSTAAQQFGKAEKNGYSPTHERLLTPRRTRTTPAAP